MTDSPGLEERVAALEARMAPMYVTYSSLPPLTEAEMTGIRESAAEALKLGPPPRHAPEPPPLSPAQVRYLLRECVTIVKPGETLILRVPWTTPPTQVRELQGALTNGTEYREMPFKVLVVPGDELTVAEPAP